MQTCKKFNIKHFIFASTSSVYGDTKSFPTNEKNSISKPLSFYAATKASNEVMSYSYSNIFKLPSTALRLLQFMVHLEDQIWLYLNLQKT